MVFIPHECLRDANVKLKVQETIAHVVGWSLSCATSGVWPSSGPFGEVLSKHRKHQQGKPLAGGQYKACYFGYRADGKARRESHLFPRSFLHSFVCEQCLAQKERKNWEPLMSYKCFYQSAAYRMTTISHTDYMQHTRPLSPWRVIDGWHLGTVFHDPMHVLYLGICKDLYASALGYWIRQGYYGEGTLSDKLRCFSSELKRASIQQRLVVSCKMFTPANTGLDVASHYPEMGSTFKAAFMKTAIWIFAAKAMELTASHPADNILRLIAVCMWNLHRAVFLMDHADILLSNEEAEEISGCFELHLISWQHLAHECEVKKMKLFKIRPKHHSADHLASQLARTKLNPRRVMACFGDESFLGYI